QVGLAAVLGVHVAVAPARLALAGHARPVLAQRRGVLAAARGPAGAAVLRVLGRVHTLPAAALQRRAQALAAGVVEAPRHADVDAAARLADLSRRAVIAGDT